MLSCSTNTKRMNWEVTGGGGGEKKEKGKQLKCEEGKKKQGKEGQAGDWIVITGLQEEG